MNLVRFGSVLTLFAFSLPAALNAQDYKSGIEWQMPPVVTPGATDDAPPSDAIVLFDGKDMSAWEGGDWRVEDGVAYSGKGNIQTKQSFGDIQLHIEWSAPTEIKGEGQGRGNSGVYLMGLYEVQILDSYENETYFDGQAGSVYKQTPPMVNAMRKPGEWNTYDIFWTAPRFKVNGDLESPACVTLVHNGILALNHFELMGPSSFVEPPHYTVHAPTGPIRLQDHGNPVRFRNIWVRELHPPVGKRVRAPYVLKGGKEIPYAQAEAEKLNEQQRRMVQDAVQKAVQKALREAEAERKKQADTKTEAKTEKKDEAASKPEAESGAEPSPKAEK
ncbi:MAG: DUF1080 domain-containing protein [Planctomycetaceae bacterium]|nr:DUF1080 domain-containing protein [Planctomycetaceae bacterium]